MTSFTQPNSLYNLHSFIWFVTIYKSPSLFDLSQSTNHHRYPILVTSINNLCHLTPKPLLLDFLDTRKYWWCDNIHIIWTSRRRHSSHRSLTLPPPPPPPPLKSPGYITALHVYLYMIWICNSFMNQSWIVMSYQSFNMNVIININHDHSKSNLNHITPPVTMSTT